MSDQHFCSDSSGVAAYFCGNKHPEPVGHQQSPIKPAGRPDWELWLNVQLPNAVLERSEASLHSTKNQPLFLFKWSHFLIIF